jgi:hypothetical protein
MILSTSCLASTASMRGGQGTHNSKSWLDAVGGGDASSPYGNLTKGHNGINYDSMVNKHYEVLVAIGITGMHYGYIYLINLHFHSQINLRPITGPIQMRPSKPSISHY